MQCLLPFSTYGEKCLVKTCCAIQGVGGDVINTQITCWILNTTSNFYVYSCDFINK
jgi:hypothetical protein